jgi:hypothetical protein
MTMREDSAKCKAKSTPSGEDREFAYSCFRPMAQTSEYTRPVVARSGG